MWLRFQIVWFLFVLDIFIAGCSTPSPTAGVRLNQIQVIGTHNSYHLRADDSLMKLIAAPDPQAARDLDYSHRPLREQLSQLGIRQLELDCYADPEGGNLIYCERCILFQAAAKTMQESLSNHFGGFAGGWAGSV
jgi:hypothetical protein